MTILRFPIGRMGLLRLVLGLLAALGFGLAGAAQAQTAPRKVALVIGNSNYVNLGGLPNPGNDAELVAAAARKAGFQTVVVVKDLGLPAFRKALTDFQSQVAGADVAMVYYAGHGIERQGKNYLIPTDVVLHDPSELQVEAIPLDYVLDKLAGARRIVVLLDACRDNPLKETWSARGTAPGNGLGLVQPPDSSIVIFSAQPGVIAVDGDGVNSNFAIALNKYLSQPGVPLKDLGGLVQDSVYSASNKFQKPYIINNLGADTFALVPLIKAEEPEDPALKEFAAWGKAEKEGTAVSYSEYLRQFPNGQFAEQAKISIRVLCRNNPACVDQPVSPQPGTMDGGSALATKIESAAPSAAATSTGTPANVPQDQARPSPAVQPTLASSGSGVTGTASGSLPTGSATPLPPPVPCAANDTRTECKAPCVEGDMRTECRPQPCKFIGDGCPIAGMPQIPAAPVFARGNYPNCLDEWLAAKDALAASESTKKCLGKFYDYQEAALNGYKESLKQYSIKVNAMNDEVKGTSTKYLPAQQDAFFNESLKIYQQVRQLILNDQNSIGDIGKEYIATLADWRRDLKIAQDNYNKSVGCGGYPTPSGLARMANCPVF